MLAVINDVREVLERDKAVLRLRKRASVVSPVVARREGARPGLDCGSGSDSNRREKSQDRRDHRECVGVDCDVGMMEVETTLVFFLVWTGQTRSC